MGARKTFHLFVRLRVSGKPTTGRHHYAGPWDERVCALLLLLLLPAINLSAVAVDFVFICFVPVSDRMSEI